MKNLRRLCAGLVALVFVAVVLLDWLWVVNMTHSYFDGATSVWSVLVALLGASCITAVAVILLGKMKDNVKNF